MIRHLRSFFFFLLLASPVFSGCSHVISQEARRAVTPGTNFEEVKGDVESHLGDILLLGGTIVNTEVAKVGTTLEVFRWKLDHWGEPVAVDENAGRFLLKTPRLLDPAIYAPGRLITATGQVIDQQTRPLGQIEYRYPVFEAREIYLWDTPFRYGIHPHPNVYFPYYVGPEDFGRTSPYDPGYYYYPYTPYWIRPNGK